MQLKSFAATRKRERERERGGERGRALATKSGWEKVKKRHVCVPLWFRAYKTRIWIRVERTSTANELQRTKSTETMKHKMIPTTQPNNIYLFFELGSVCFVPFVLRFYLSPNKNAICRTFLAFYWMKWGWWACVVLPFVISAQFGVERLAEKQILCVWIRHSVRNCYSNCCCTTIFHTP